ncbi:MAG: hypothetical protein JPMHGGIA_01904 [Saprospiraceae bacterium]|nr:hypothetical protein [Saprospiraceae bacterium]
MHLFQPQHFIMPFAAHALGTFSGAFIAVSLSGTRPIAAAMAVGLVFLVGGIINVVMLPSPLWFTLTDLLLAYLSMAWLGTQLSRRIFRTGTPLT